MGVYRSSHWETVSVLAIQCAVELQRTFCFLTGKEILFLLILTENTFQLQHLVCRELRLWRTMDRSLLSEAARDRFCWNTVFLRRK